MKEVHRPCHIVGLALGIATCAADKLFQPGSQEVHLDHTMCIRSEYRKSIAVAVGCIRSQCFTAPLPLSTHWVVVVGKVIAIVRVTEATGELVPVEGAEVKILN